MIWHLDFGCLPDYTILFCSNEWISIESWAICCNIFSVHVSSPSMKKYCSTVGSKPSEIDYSHAPHTTLHVEMVGNSDSVNFYDMYILPFLLEFLSNIMVQQKSAISLFHRIHRKNSSQRQIITALLKLNSPCYVKPVRVMHELYLIE
jgi:hypothetical protein